MTPDLPHLPTSDQWERCHVQRTVARKPTTWSWFGVPRWCTPVRSGIHVPVSSFFDGMFLGFFRVKTDLGKWEFEFSGFGAFGEVFFRWIPRIWDLLGCIFQLRDPMGTVSYRSGACPFHRNLKEPPPNTTRSFWPFSGIMIPQLFPTMVFFQKCLTCRFSFLGGKGHWEALNTSIYVAVGNIFLPSRTTVRDILEE